MGCECLNKKQEEEEINKEEKVDPNKSDPAIVNQFNLNEYENAILVENNVVDDKITDLDTNFVKENNETTNRFNSRVLDLINKIRRDPPSYANTILENIQYISNENNKLIFKKKVKVLLNKGEEAFRNAAEELKKTAPMNDLTIKNEIAIPLPLSQEEINDNALLINQVNIIRQNYNINVYFKNMIKNPEIAVLLLIVDDSANSPGAKRRAILNPHFRKIGINSKFINTTFVSFFSFSK
jgi:uncharacterized protein YkwD